MIETPNTFWNPAANTASHIIGRTSADNSRPRCCTNLTISRVVTARSARPAWTSCIAFSPRSPVQTARRLRLVIAERIELVALVEKALDRRARDHLVRCREQNRLAQLVIPGPHAYRQALVAVEASLAKDELALLGEIRRARAQRGLHHHLDRDPGRPIRTLHVAPARALLEARVDLRRAIVLPGPMPGGGLEVDAADHRPRAHRVIRHRAGKIEGVIGDEHHVVVAVDRGKQRRVVLLPL